MMSIMSERRYTERVRNIYGFRSELQMESFLKYASLTSFVYFIITFSSELQNNLEILYYCVLGHLTYQLVKRIKGAKRHVNFLYKCVSGSALLQTAHKVTGQKITVLLCLSRENIAVML